MNVQGKQRQGHAGHGTRQATSVELCTDSQSPRVGRPSARSFPKQAGLSSCSIRQPRDFAANAFFSLVVTLSIDLHAHD